MASRERQLARSINLAPGSETASGSPVDRKHDAIALQLLYEKGVDKKALKMRAAALEKMGEIFVEVGRTHKETSESGGDIKAKQQMAQDRIEKAMHATLEKMDRADQEAMVQGATSGSRPASP